MESDAPRRHAPTRARLRYVWLFVAIVVVYLCTLSDRQFGLISDGVVMFDTAVSLHAFGELGIGPEVEPKSGEMVRADRYGKYGLGLPVVLQIPLLVAGPIEKALGEGRSNVLFPFTNLLIMATAALLVAVCLQDLGSRFSISALAASAFAFGTFAWPYISYDFSEPLQALTLVAGFWCLIAATRRAPPSAALLLVAGSTLGFAVLTKAALAILLPSYLLYAWTAVQGPARERWRRLAWFATPLALWAGAIAILNWQRFGSPVDFGYGSEAGQFTTPLLTGLYGLLISPNKGLVFYAPLALLAPWALWKMRKRQRNEAVFFASVFVFAIVFNAKWWSWEGGASWGPRLLLPILPLLAICTGRLLESTPRSRIPFVAALALGGAINMLGVLLFFLVWTSVVDLHGNRVALDLEERPAAEYVERDGKKWFVPDIATYYVPALSPIRGHAWLLELRYLDIPFSLAGLCQGGRWTGPLVSFPPLQLNFANLRGPLVDHLCSANLWLWDTVTGRPRQGEARVPLYAVALEVQGNRAAAQNKLARAVDSYERAAELMPGFARPVLKLTELLVQMNRMVEAQQALERFLTHYPMDTAARFALARVYELAGNRATALREYQALLRYAPPPNLGRLAQERIAALQHAGE